MKVGRLDLIEACRCPLLVPEEVKGEVRRPEQMAMLQRAIDAGWLTVETIIAREEVVLFAELAARGSLGPGERSVLAIALSRGIAAGVQEKLAREEGLRRNRGLQLVSIEDIVRLAISHGAIRIDEADALLKEWKLHHRFSSQLATFR